MFPARQAFQITKTDEAAREPAGKATVGCSYPSKWMRSGAEPRKRSGLADGRRVSTWASSLDGNRDHDNQHLQRNAVSRDLESTEYNELATRKQNDPGDNTTSRQPSRLEEIG